MGACTAIAAGLHGACNFCDFPRNFCTIPVAAVISGPSTTRHSTDHAVPFRPSCARAWCATANVTQPQHGICSCREAKLGAGAPRAATTSPHFRPLPFRPIEDLPVCAQLPQLAQPLDKKLPWAKTFRTAGLASHKSAVFCETRLRCLG